MTFLGIVTALVILITLTKGLIWGVVTLSFVLLLFFLYMLTVGDGIARTIHRD